MFQTGVTQNFTAIQPHQQHYQRIYRISQLLLHNFIKLNKLTTKQTTYPSDVPIPKNTRHYRNYYLAVQKQAKFPGAGIL